MRLNTSRATAVPEMLAELAVTGGAVQHAGHDLASPAQAVHEEAIGVLIAPPDKTCVIVKEQAQIPR